MINCRSVYEYIKFKKYNFEMVCVQDIGYKELDSSSITLMKINRSNPNLPCILVKGMKNPMNKPYRMIDGRHRLQKAINEKALYIKAFVIPEKEIMKFVECGNAFDTVHKNF
jgi:hypothetical protein